VSEDSTAGFERELTDLADAWAAAIVANDADRIAEYVADDWVMVSQTGISAGTDFLTMVRSGALTHSMMRRIGPARVRRCGDTAVFTARVVNTAHHQGRQFDADEWTTDVFVKGGDGWRCILSQITAAG